MAVNDDVVISVSVFEAEDVAGMVPIKLTVRPIQVLDSNAVGDVMDFDTQDVDHVALVVGLLFTRITDRNNDLWCGEVFHDYLGYKRYCFHSAPGEW